MSQAEAWLVGRLGVARAAAGLAAVGLSATAFAGWSVIPLVSTLALCAVLTGVLSTSARTRPLVPFLVLALALLSGLSLGAVRTYRLYDPGLGPWVDRVVTAEVTVVGAVRSAGGKLSAPVEVKWAVAPTDDERERLRALPCGDRLLLEWGAPTAAREPAATAPAGSDDTFDRPAGSSPVEGAILRVSGRIASPEPPGTGGYNQRTYLRTQRIALRLVAQPKAVSIVGYRRGVAGTLDLLRSRSRRHLSQGLSPPWSGLLQGVVLGDTGGIPMAIREAFRRSGTAHILSVSGLHVASLAAAVALVLRMLPVGRLPRLVVTLGILAAFAALTGARPSVVRAVIMLALYLVARDLGRARDRAQIILVAALVILIRNPFALFDPGAQLSFAAVGGLTVLALPLERRMSAAVPGPVAAGVAVSLAATLATAPLSLAHFDQVSLVAVPANLLVVAVVTPVMVLGLASLALGFLWLPLCAALNTVSGTLLGWIVTVAGLCARAPVLRNDHAGWVAAALLGAGGSAYVGLMVSGRLPPLSVHRRPGGWVSPRWAAWVSRSIHRGPGRRSAVATPVRVARRRANLLLAGLAVAGGVAGVVALSLGMTAHQSLARAWGGRSWPEVAEVRVLDVGEGSATLVRTPDHHTVLLDAGPSGRSLDRQLRALGVGRLDLVVVSHPHADHFGGLGDVEGELAVERIIDGTDPAWLDRCSGEVREAGAYAEVLARLRAAGASIERAQLGAVAHVDGVELEFYAPAQTPGSRWDADELNRSSVVVRVRASGMAVLVPGDAEADALARYPLPPVDVVVVPHHGSRDAVDAEVLAMLDPQIGVISVGKENSFGHPSEQTLEVLQAAGAMTLRTDVSGWVAIGAGASGVSVTVERRPP